MAEENSKRTVRINPNFKYQDWTRKEKLHINYLRRKARKLLDEEEQAKGSQSITDFLAEPEPAAMLDIPDVWAPKDKRRRAAIKHSYSQTQTKHGLLSAVPMVCRDNECPYKDFCIYQQRGEVVRGERCVKEIGEIIGSTKAYYEEFNIDPSDSGARVDVAQTNQLITLEVLIRRCEMLLAKGDLIELIEIAIDPKSGESVMQPQLHKAAEALPKLQRRHGEILRDLNATRKEKLASSAALGMSLAAYNKEILRASAVAQERLRLMREGKYAEADKLQQLEGDTTIEGEFETIDNPEVKGDV